jgi:hypothetical protein
VRRAIQKWGIRLGKGSFYLCEDGGWGLLEVTQTKTFDDYDVADRALKKIQKQHPAANVSPL